MLRIPCPFCGDRVHTEFTYGGDATVTRPAEDASEAAWMDYVYLRDNPRGGHLEWWHHAHGCRQWIKLRRDTLSHAIDGAAPAHEPLGRGPWEFDDIGESDPK